MKKDDIIVGKIYLAGSYGKQKVKVIGAPVKNRYSSKTYDVPVETMDSEPRQMKVPTRDFVSEWTSEDEAQLQRTEEIRIQMEDIHNRLVFAGYPTAKARYMGDRGLYITFEGDDAERVVKILIGEVEGNEKEAARTDSDA